ncbi:MAG TPA: M6 family metalloprotease domain-containing protein [Kiritimatiellia bacterium]|nr:M6 family metalloprotease domain-containing protein [Kiritimatiellia bacterium]
MKHKVLTVLCMGVLAAACVSAAPFAKTFRFTQPDGTRIEVWGEGDEFRAVFEHGGYTVVLDPVTKAYTYARLSADGTELLPTRLLAGRDDPALNGLPQHLRVDPAAAAARARERFERWDAGMQIRRRWEERKSQMQMLRAQAAGGRGPMAPPLFTTTGTKVGLCLLIDFPDAQASVPRANIQEFCNGDGYTGYGNNGSVKAYFHDVSGGLLTYTNVVTAYIRMQKPHSFYCDITQDAGSQGNLLIADAIAILKAQPNYETEILPTFASLSQEDNGHLVACNVFYAGGNGGRWSYGLWPHSWSLYEAGAQDLGDGKKIFKYQITDIGDALELGTFCHENGHMLCDFPDLYDYDYDSVGGAGNFCLMGSGGNDDRNPVQLCAYLKFAAGWTTTIEVEKDQYLLAELSSAQGSEGFNRIYRYAKPGTPTEYYLFENRQKSGRDATLPAAGIAIWHIDELGDRDDQRMEYNTQHQNYECTLVQADNQWHFQKNQNSGDARDLYYAGNPAAGYVNRFADDTAPSARWWDESVSEMKVESFSASGPVMTFVFQVRAPVITTTSPLPVGRVGTPYAQTLKVTYGVFPYVWELIQGDLPDGISFSDTGVLAGMPEEHGTFDFVVTATGQNGLAATNQFSLTILPVAQLPFVEPFENGATLWAEGWTQEFVTNQLSWTFQNGNGGAGSPLTAHGGLLNACFRTFQSDTCVTRLITPRLAFPTDARLPRLRFWHYMTKQGVFQDRLRVYYKTAYTNSWTMLAEYKDNVGVWRERVLDLPAVSPTTYLAFEGDARYGFGVHIDDITVSDEYTPFVFMMPEVLPTADMSAPYACLLQTVGGFGPFTFELADGSALPHNLELSTNGVISGIATHAGTYTFTVHVTDLGDTPTPTVLTNTFTLNVGLPRVELFREDFENGGRLPSRWRTETVAGQLSWKFLNGGGNGDALHSPASAYEGNYNAVLWAEDASDHVTRLVTVSGINLGVMAADPRLEFWHCMKVHESNQDELRVYGKSGAASEWQLLGVFTNNVTEWTRRVLPIPASSTNYFLAFEGNARSGHGVCIDDIRVTVGSLAPIITTPRWLPAAWAGKPYSYTLSAAGGQPDYSWEVVAGTLPAGLTLSANGTLSGTPSQKVDALFSIRVTGSDGYSSTNAFELSVTMFRLPFEEGAEDGMATPWGWTQEGVPSSVGKRWAVGAGSPQTGDPATAYSGTNNFYLSQSGSNQQTVRLITPQLDMGEGMTNATLSFWLCMPKTLKQNTLKVYYASNASESVWNELVTVEKPVPAWSNIVLSLPDPSPTYRIAFEGTLKGTDGICLDDISVTGDYPPPTGGYAAWLLAAFGPEITDEETIGMTADPDGDGLANWLEYAMALDPNAQDSEFAMDGGVTAGYLTLSYRRNPLAHDVTFTVEACDDLSAPLWTTDWVSQTGEEDFTDYLWITHRHDLPVTDAPRRFLRLVITPPAP